MTSSPTSSSISPRVTATMSSPSAAGRSPAESWPSASAWISPPPSPDPTTLYNRAFTTNGIACTTASAISAILGIPDPEAMTDDDVERVKRMHLLLAMYNAFQPGVFALSGWDLTGMLTIDPSASGRPHRRGRHALDQPRRTRPHGHQPQGPALGGRPAAGPQPVRHAPRSAPRPLLVRAAAAPHHQDPPPLPHPDGHADRRPGRVAPLAAGDGASAGERGPAGDRAQLRPRGGGRARSAPSISRRRPR